MKQAFFIFLLFLSLSGRTQFKLEADSTKINKLNTAMSAEAFPFISADGLRLYFTSGQEGLGRIYISKRKHVNAPFLKCVPLSSNLPDSLFGGTLTSNELEMYLFDGWQAYYSKRKNKSEQFSKPVSIPELGECHRAPSISPIGDELIVINSSGCDDSRRSRDTVRLLAKNAVGSFERISTLNYPEGFEPGQGQFSKNGLSYIMTVSKRWYDRDKEWLDSTLVLKYVRNSLRQPFEEYQVILNELNKKPMQISIDASESILVAVVSTDMWRSKSTDLVYYHIKKNNVKTTAQTRKKG
jgi:hypothetical protein